MKCISIKQPWAWLIFHGKEVENRTWKHPHRGPLLIHAGKAFDWEGLFWVVANMPNIAAMIPFSELPNEDVYEIAQKALLSEESHDWQCGCGHWNGPNLSECTLCRRSLSEIVSLSRAWTDKPIGSVETERFINDFWELIDRYHLFISDLSFQEQQAIKGE